MFIKKYSAEFHGPIENQKPTFEEIEELIERLKECCVVYGHEYGYSRPLHLNLKTRELLEKIRAYGCNHD